MANHKSALKRHRQSMQRRSRNRINKSIMKNAVKALEIAVTENSVDDAQAALKAAVPAIVRAAVKGTIHKKTASRKVSRLTKRVNALAANA
ncbi:MAG: 30S ribosomal protein S20 [Proteobacteria bacterium]|nr:30S ribosomal protein S20 [Pseudomonadota bacterium]MBU1688852.1 30S ribosomal protein S20 [Pseudomonadota bacterium]